MVDALNLIAGVAYASVFFYIFYLIKKRNLFWVHFLFIEYFYLIGLGFYPLLLAFGYLPPPGFLKSENVSLATPIHVMAYALGALLAFVLLSGRRFDASTINIRRLNISPKKSYCAIVVIPLVFFILYLYFVGVQQAVMGASYARSGNFEYFEEGNKFAFLTRPVLIGGLSAAYAYYFIFKKGMKWRYFYIFTSIFLGIMTYLISVSRFALLQGIFLPMGFYIIYKLRGGLTSKSFAIFIVLIAGVMAFSVFLYGKFILYQIAAYLYYGDPLDFNVGEAQGADIGAFSHLYYSINAGIENFFDSGPFVARDIILSIFGVVPGAFFQAIGLEGLSYQLLDSKNIFSCINTQLIADDGGCYIPPYFTGVSAYVFPVVGGFAFGLVRYVVYAAVVEVWDQLASTGEDRFIPVLLILFYFAEQIMLFIPATISMVVFMGVVAIFLKKFISFEHE